MKQIEQNCLIIFRIGLRELHDQFIQTLRKGIYTLKLMTGSIIFRIFITPVYEFVYGWWMSNT